MSGFTYRHYAHHDPLAIKAIMTIPQPSAFKGLHMALGHVLAAAGRLAEFTGL